MSMKITNLILQLNLPEASELSIKQETLWFFLCSFGGKLAITWLMVKI